MKKKLFVLASLLTLFCFFITPIVSEAQRQQPRQREMARHPRARAAHHMQMKRRMHRREMRMEMRRRHHQMNRRQHARMRHHGRQQQRRFW